jgi:tetratricopeptide (TPR) repeat protein
MSSTTEALLTEGHQARREHRLEDAKRIFAEAVEAARSSKDRPTLAEALAGLGQIERDLGGIDAARQHYEEAVVVCRATGDSQKLAHMVRHLGDILREEERWLPAQTCYEEALEIYRWNPETPPLDLANAIRGFALLKDKTGRHKDALDLWREARELYKAVNVEAGVEEGDRQIERLSQVA